MIALQPIRVQRIKEDQATELQLTTTICHPRRDLAARCARQTETTKTTTKNKVEKPDASPFTLLTQVKSTPRRSRRYKSMQSSEVARFSEKRRIRLDFRRQGLRGSKDLTENRRLVPYLCRSSSIMSNSVSRCSTISTISFSISRSASMSSFVFFSSANVSHTQEAPGREKIEDSSRKKTGRRSKRRKWSREKQLQTLSKSSLEMVQTTSVFKGDRKDGNLKNAGATWKISA